MTRLHPRLAALVVALFCSACTTEYRQSSINPTTDFAETIHGLYNTVFWWTVLILAVVWIVLGYVLVRFRERPGAPLPKQTHGHLGLEIAWTLGPALIVIAIAVPTIQALFETQRGDPENNYIIDVVGRQFWWEFRYPEGVVTANELYLPVDRPISLRLQSGDVIHSFWIPQLGGKRDLNPPVARPEGVATHYNWIHFTVREPGVYMGQCAEFCGLAHSLMGMRAIALPDGEFQSWLAAWQAGDPQGGAPPAGVPAGAAGDSVAPAPGANPGGVPPGSPVPGVTPPPGGDATGALPSGLDPSGATTPDAAAGAPDPALADPDAPGLETAEAAPPQAPAPDAAAAERGRQVFQGAICVACHAVQGTPAQGVLGPNLTLFGRRLTLGAGWLENNQENLVRWIMNPAGIKPGVLMPGVGEPGGGWPATNLTEAQVRDLAAYLLSLR